MSTLTPSADVQARVSGVAGSAGWRGRIAYVVSLFPCWSETFIAEEIHHLLDLGFDIEIFSLRPHSEPHVHDLSVGLLPRVRYPFPRTGVLLAQFHFLLRRPGAYLKQLLRVLFTFGKSLDMWAKGLAAFFLGAYFARKIRESGFQRIHAHWATYSATAAWTISQLTGLPFSFTTHAHDLFDPDALLSQKLRDAQFVVTISEYNRGRINAIRPSDGKVRIVHCGVDTTRFAAVPAYDWEAHRLLSVGRLVPMKGFDVLIEACRILRDKGLSFTCEIVGDGPMRPELEEQIGAAKLADRVRLAGFAKQDELRDKLKKVSMFVLACQQSSARDMDGIPVALMEPMSMGIPVVSTSVSGIPELIDNGRNGLLVPPRDPAKLAEAIESLLRDRARSLAFAEAGRETVLAEFDVRRNAERLGRFFTETSCPGA